MTESKQQEPSQERRPTIEAVPEEAFSEAVAADPRDPNLGIKLRMATELLEMGLPVDAVSRILHIGPDWPASSVAGVKTEQES